MEPRVKIALGIALTLVIVGGLIFGIVTLATREPYFLSEHENCENANIPDSITVQNDNGSYLISWFEPWPNSVCDATYHLQYSVDDGQKVQINTTNSYYTISNTTVENCSILRLHLWAIGQIGVISENSVTKTYQESPTSIGKVQDVKINDAWSGSLAIIWKSHANFTRCNVKYTVTAINPTAGKATCSGFSSCDIILSNFCPSTSLVIVASSLDGQTILGESTTETYNC